MTGTGAPGGGPSQAEASMSMKTARIALTDAMASPAAKRVIAVLRGEGAEVRFVGGCVRDAVLGRAAHDIDIATTAQPEQVMAALERAGVKVIPTGIEHGTVTAVAEGEHFEITTLRHDVSTDGRWAEVAFIDDWVGDAARRDFTFNALSLTPEGVLYDPFGGLEDLKAGRVRFVGNARKRIEEDVLRLLRFFRFHARFGVGEPDAEAVAACRDMAGLIPMLSAERVRDELLRILAADRAPATLDFMAELEVLPHVLPGVVRTDALAALVVIERGEDEADAVRRLALTLATGAADLDAVDGWRRRLHALRLSNAEQSRIALLIEEGRGVAPDADDAEKRRMVYRLGGARVVDLALDRWARAARNRPREARDHPDAPGYRAWLNLARTWDPPRLPVAGRDLLDAGVERGPRIGRLLSAVEDWWVEQDFKPDRAACLDRLMALLEKDR